MSNSPPRPPTVKYHAPLGTRWEKEKAAAESGAFDYPDDPVRIGPWILGECVGKGASGRVKIAKNRNTGQLAAVKILPLQPLVNSRASLATQTAKSNKQTLGIDREIIMMKLMNHPNILRIYDVYEGEKDLFLVLEYVQGGELFDFLVNRGRLASLEALLYFKQIIYALNYAHTFSIIHRDLKPENILIHSLSPPHIKVADWGMAAFAPPALQLETSCGSPHYASPEIVNGKKYEGNASDIWSCGVVLYALLTGRLPFDDKDLRNLLDKVRTGRYEIPDFVDPLAKDLISRMLIVNVAERITIPEILSHPWFSIPTPEIIYVPPPPISDLARPLPSASHFDSNLLDSLRVIWGRHGDLESIKADLLSPPGEGSLAKAFYFLLDRHRERTWKENGVVWRNDEQGDKVVTKLYVKPRSARCGKHLYVKSTRTAPAPPGTGSPSPQPSIRGRPSQKHTLPCGSPPAYQRAPSPIGPRPSPKERPVSSPVSTKHRHSSFNPGPPNMFSHTYDRRKAQPTTSAGYEHLLPSRGTSKYPSERRPIRYPSFIPPGEGPDLKFTSVRDEGHAGKDSTCAKTVFSPPYGVQESTVSPREGDKPYFAPSQFISSSHDTKKTHAPSTYNRYSSFSPPSNMIPSQQMPPPSPAPMSPVMPMYAPVPVLPMLTAPRTGNATLQRTIDEITEQVNVLVARENIQAQAQRVVNTNFGAPGHRMSTYRADEQPPVTRPLHIPVFRDDKENRVPFTDMDTVPVVKHGGLGFGQVGREMGNIVAGDGSNVATENVGKKGKENRLRPPTLDMHSLDTKYRTVLSPVSPLQSPASNTPSSILASPALGEVKGWFSNLFNWKAHSYALGSSVDVWSTRTEVKRILEHLGVRIREDMDVFKCVVEDRISQRQVKFRVHFSVDGGHCHSDPNSQTYAHSSSNRFSMNAGKANGSGTENSYASVVILVLEKGSVSTFRNVHRRLREDWTLDSKWDVMHLTPVAVGGQSCTS